MFKKYMMGWIVLAAVLCPLIIPSPGAGAGFSRMWEGEEMWQLGESKYKGNKENSPGISIGWNNYTYPGNGPLPDPKEIKAPLGKVLPPGKYEITVGSEEYEGVEEVVIVGSGEGTEEE